ncbi:MAG: glycosyltransferase [Bacteroidota bacterium]|nr:glycosyltransferase [Bacteroidota bacterium]
MSDHIHIVCLDAPSPPDYGGAIDMYYKIKALGEIGKKIVLHYYNYNPVRHTRGLENYCTEIIAYRRKRFATSLPLSTPFIVKSRENKALVDRLNKDRHPILLEGLHCAGLVPLIQNRKRIILRMHNEEASYYRHLANTETSFLKMLYFRQESRLLANFQKQMDKHIPLACLSESDMEQCRKEYGFKRLFFLPCFLPWQSVNSQPGRGEYCLYHGNLSVSENEEAAIWLIENVFSEVPAPFVIAGKSISTKVAAKAKKHANIKLVNNPPIDEIDALVRDAHIHVLPSMNRTGVKLKLLNALLNGRFCITNQSGVMGSRIEEGVIVAETKGEWKTAIEMIMQKEFTQEDQAERGATLALYNNQVNAQKLSEQWKHYQ